MDNRHRLLASTAAVAASVAVALAGLSAASASPARPAASGTEHFQLITTSDSGATPVIMYGVVTTHGVDHEGSKTDAIKLGGGGFKLIHTERTGTEHMNKNCLAKVFNDGTYKLSGGTGTYKGVRGHGTYRFTQLFIARKVNGVCHTNLPLKGFQEIVYASGPMSR
jgi:hypothetical protein